MVVIIGVVFPNAQYYLFPLDNPNGDHFMFYDLGVKDRNPHFAIGNPERSFGFGAYPARGGIIVRWTDTNEMENLGLWNGFWNAPRQPPPQDDVSSMFANMGFRNR